MSKPTLEQTNDGDGMEIYTKLLSWAAGQSIDLNGLSPQRIPGRGIGIVATRRLKKDEILLKIPTTALRTLDTVSKPLTRSLPLENLSVQGILAVDLALTVSPPEKHGPWNAVMPTRKEVWSGLPITWDSALHDFLPRPARDLLSKQQSKFERDWDVVLSTQASRPDLFSSGLSRDDYLYAWLLVNTRSFYYDISTKTGTKLQRKRRKTLSRDDKMVLMPVADLFNHSDAGCGVGFDDGGFTVTADRAYEEGEEVYVCYGRHSNDFLLVEYGFVPRPRVAGRTGNAWDEVKIDDAILGELSARRNGKRTRALLEERGYLGNYVLDATTGEACYRTQVALRAMSPKFSEARWTEFVDNGVDEGDETQREEVQKDADRLLARILRRYLRNINKTVSDVEETKGAGEQGQRDLLCLRWRQIRDVITTSIDSLSIQDDTEPDKEIAEGAYDVPKFISGYTQQQEQRKVKKEDEKKPKR